MLVVHAHSGMDLSRGGRLRAWWARNWLTLANTSVAILLLGAFVAPLAAAAGQMALAESIHRLYLLLCPQRPSHSYFLFGQQTALEHREIAMFAAQLAAGAAYARFRGCRLVSWWLLGALSAPMALDAVSQAVGLRSSDWFARSWTGGLFSTAYTLWFYPRMDEVLGVRLARPWGGRHDQ